MMPARHLPSMPFHTFSSFNKKGGRTHPKVLERHNRILDLWAAMASYNMIAEELDIAVSTVVEYIAKAKRMNDPRAVRVYRHRKIQLSQTKRWAIKRLLKEGYTAREIAKQLGCTKRLVLIRMKEDAA